MGPLITSFGLVLLLAVLLSGLAGRTVLSTAVLFLAAGFVLGPALLGVLPFQAGDDAVAGIAQLALFVVLFTDGQRVSVRDLAVHWHLPGRALLFGMPLTFAISAVLGVVLVGMSWTEALLVAAVLAPTDPVFASAIVGREEIPIRVRSLLNVESGLNDGIALPFVILLIGVAGHRESHLLALVLEVCGGIALGIAVPLLVELLLRIRLLAQTRLYAALAPAAVAILVYGLALVTGANLYLAAFSAGVTIASAAPAMRDAFAEIGEYVAEVVKLFAIFLFGSLVSPAALGDVPPLGYVFAVLLLVLARPLAVEIALLGSGLSWQERLTAAWFGPKGFASVLYGLLVLDSGLPRADHLYHLIVVAISLSIVAHSSTDVPIAHYFDRQQQGQAGRAPA